MSIGGTALDETKKEKSKKTKAKKGEEDDIKTRQGRQKNEK